MSRRMQRILRSCSKQSKYFVHTFRLEVGDFTRL